MATIDVLDADGVEQTIERPLVPGRAAAADSRPVVFSNEDFAVLDGLEAALASISTEAKQDSAITQETAAAAALGVTSGAAVITDANGTVQQYLRGLIKQWIAGTLVLGTGANAIGKLAANTGVVIGAVEVVPAAAPTVGGLSATFLVSAANNNAQTLAAAAKRLYWYDICNNHATAFRYVKFYNKATSPTVGTDTPLFIIGVPPVNRVTGFLNIGILFSAGVSIAIVAGVANSDNTAIGISEVALSIAIA